MKFRMGFDPGTTTEEQARADALDHWARLCGDRSRDVGEPVVEVMPGDDGTQVVVVSDPPGE